MKSVYVVILNNHNMGVVEKVYIFKTLREASKKAKLLRSKISSMQDEVLVLKRSLK